MMAGRGALLLWLLAVVVPAQIVATAAVGAPDGSNPHFGTGSALGQIGIALPAIPHVLPLWNMAGLSYDRIEGQGGGSIQTGLETWVSPAAHPAQSWSPLLLAEVALGRRWGDGLHGYSAEGLGVGWSLGDWVPFVEFRRRSGFHAASPTEHEIVVGVKFILFS
jgi:hypothetical protein